MHFVSKQPLKNYHNWDKFHEKIDDWYMNEKLSGYSFTQRILQAPRIGIMNLSAFGTSLGFFMCWYFSAYHINQVWTIQKKSYNYWSGLPLSTGGKCITSILCHNSSINTPNSDEEDHFTSWVASYHCLTLIPPMSLPLWSSVGGGGPISRDRFIIVGRGDHPYLPEYFLSEIT